MPRNPKDTFRFDINSALDVVVEVSTESTDDDDCLSMEIFHSHHCAGRSNARLVLLLFSAAV
jgi:hypothetical protein